MEAFGGSTVQSIRRMNTNQQILLGGVFVAVVALIFFVSRLGGSTSMGILYSGLEPETAAAVVDELESRGIPYELSDSGRVVWVPRQQVAEARLDMSAMGLPGSSDGWSILDEQGITSSEFDQRVGYQRAMEGELASTIAVIDGVAGANVHLVIPEQDLFVGDEIQASASVLLQTGGGASISPMQVQSIVNLVASSVEGLSADQVTVTDDAGRLLAGGDDQGLASMESDNQLRMRESFETDLERELSQLLAAVVGPDRAVVTVNAELDFDTVVRTEETFNESTNAAGETLPRSETTRLEQYADPGDIEGGVVEIEEEILDGPEAGGADGSAYRLDERDVIYALDSVITSTETAPGAITSLSVAVAIDEAALPAERVAEIEQMVTAAVGADAARGDLVAVSLLPFDVSIEEAEAAALEAEEAAAAAAGNPIFGLIRLGGAVVIGLVVLILGILMLRRASRREVIDSVDLEDLPAGALGAGEDGRIELEKTEDDLLELVANQPDDIAAVLRQWLSEPENVQ